MFIHINFDDTKVVISHLKRRITLAICLLLCAAAMTDCVREQHGTTQTVPTEEEANSGTRAILQDLRQNGLTGLLENVDQGVIATFPTIHSAEYYQAHGQTESPVERQLGDALVSGLTKLCVYLKNASDDGAVRSISQVIKLKAIVVKGAGYGNLLLADGLDQVPTVVLEDRLVMTDMKLEIIQHLIEANAADPFDWETFCRAVETEMGKKLFDYKLLRNAPPERRYAYIYGMIRYGKNNAAKGLRDKLWLEMEWGVKDNWPKLAPDNFVGLVLHAREQKDILTVLAQMKASAGSFPTQQDAFLRAAVTSLPASVWLKRTPLTGFDDTLKPEDVWIRVNGHRKERDLELAIP